MESLKPGGLSSVQDIFFNSIETVSRDASLERRSRIPVRRDSSSPPSLPSSGRSTPVYRPPMQREGSSPPGLLSHHMPRPAIAPKPKLGQKQGNDSTGGHQSILGGPQSVLGGSQSVLGGQIGPFSRIPRPEAKMRKWESTSKLEVRFAKILEFMENLKLRKELSFCHKLWFSKLYIFITQYVVDLRYFKLSILIDKII